MMASHGPRVYRIAKECSPDSSSFNASGNAYTVFKNPPRLGMTVEGDRQSWTFLPRRRIQPTHRFTHFAYSGPTCSRLLGGAIRVQGPVRPSTHSGRL